MTLVWGKISQPRQSTNKYPDTEQELIITVPALGGKGTARKFAFNLHAQKELELNKQVDPETLLNSEAVFSYDTENRKAYVGIYNSEAFAAVEAAIGGKVPTLNIGKTTMSFSSKDLHAAIKAQYEDAFDTDVDNYFKMVPVELEHAPVQMYELVPTQEAGADTADTADATVSDTTTSDSNKETSEETDNVQNVVPTPTAATMPSLDPQGLDAQVSLD